MPAKLTGTVDRELVSDRDGVVRAEVPGGRYHVRIEPGCSDQVQVQTGATADIAVPVGQVVQGELRVAARRRHFPGAPVTWAPQRRTKATEEAGRQWRLGVTYVVRFTMIDRCTGKPAPGASVEGLRFDADGPLEARLQEAATTGSDGVGLVAAICRAEADEISLTVVDASLASDAVDLFDRALLDDTPPNCVSG